MLLRSELIHPDRFNNCYDLLETTSPSALILASIDATRRQFAQEGEELIQWRFPPLNGRDKSAAGYLGVNGYEA
jgi:arginine/lysine/ornithine decarboxylase